MKSVTVFFKVQTFTTQCKSVQQASRWTVTNWCNVLKNKQEVSISNFTKQTETLSIYPRSTVPEKTLNTFQNFWKEIISPQYKVIYTAQEFNQIQSIYSQFKSVQIFK
jgi:hypothetical protein